MEDKFEHFWTLYPRRLGDNPKRPAKLKFEALVKKGINPEKIIDAAEVYRLKMQSERKFDTPYVAQAVTWLNQHRFEDHTGKSAPAAIGDRMGKYMWDGGKWRVVDGA